MPIKKEEKNHERQGELYDEVIMTNCTKGMSNMVSRQMVILTGLAAYPPPHNLPIMAQASTHTNYEIGRASCRERV